MQSSDFRLFLRYFKRYTLFQGSLFSLSLFLLLVGTILQLPVPLIFREIIDRIIPSKNLGLLGLYFLLIVIVVVLREVTLYFSKVIDQKLRNGIHQKLIYELLHVYYQLPYRKVKEKDTGYFYSRVFNEPVEVEESLTTTVTFAIKVFLIFFFGLVVCLRLSWKLTLFVLILSSGFYLLNLFFGQKISHYSLKFQEVRAKFGEIAVEVLKGFKIVNLLGILERVEKVLSPGLNNYLEMRLKRTKVNGMYSGIYGILGDFLPVGVFLFGAIEIVKGNFTVGSLVAFMELMRYISSPLDSLSEIFIEVQTTTGIIERIEEFKAMVEKGGEISILGSINTISLESITIDFDGREVIKGLSFEFKKGNKYAILGPNGSGKSTLIEVITGLIQPSEGTVKLNGSIPVEKVNKRDYFNKFSVSFYPPVLLPTIRDNLALISEDRLKEVAVRDILKGRDNVKFNQLSAGEKQKLSLLIALSQIKCDFLILDEPLANLDDDSKEYYWSLIESYLEGKGLIVALPTAEVELGGFEKIYLEKVKCK